MAEEVKQMKSAEVAAPPTEIARTNAEFFGQGLPKAVKAEAPVEVAATAEAPEKQGKTKITIGDKHFETQEEAFAYAQELALSKVADEAYREGVQSTRVQDLGPEVDPAQEFLKKIGDKLFEDPAAALAEYGEFIKQSTQKDSEAKTARVQSEQAMWDGFFKTNPDVAEFPDWFKQYTVTQLDKYGNLQADKALQEISKNFRGMLKIREDALKPKTELAETSTTVVPASGNPAPSGEKSLAEALDFISAVRKHGKRELKKSR